MRQSFRRTFLKDCAGATVTGGPLFNSRSPDVTTASQSPNPPRQWTLSGELRPKFPRRNIRGSMPIPACSFGSRLQMLNGCKSWWGGGGRQTPKMDMIKQADGYWTLTTPPIVPGFHYYLVYIDGFEVTAPGATPFGVRGGT